MPLAESTRIQAVQTPIIPGVADLIRRHPGTISLGQGVVSYGPPPQAVARIESFLSDPQNNKYQPVAGIPELRESFKHKLTQENGIPFGPAGTVGSVDTGGTENDLVVTAGGNMAFVNAVFAIADPDDEIILQSPYYFNHEMAVTIAGCRPVVVATDENYQLRPHAIRQAITEKTRAVVTISPNNPTGAVYPESALREVNQICRDNNLYHIHDEAYEYFVYENAAHFSPGSIAGATGHTISLFSLSKAYGFASWRIGAMVIPGHLLSPVRKIQDTILICPPVISQFAAVGALQAGRKYCQKHLESIIAVRNVVAQQLATINNLCEVPPAQGAFYYLLRIKTDMDPMQLTERLIREHRVAVIPGSTFGLQTGCYLRVAYAALQQETAEEGIGRLARGLQQIVKPN
jgi:aspartate/methionine/tyrosine aminotransferase